MLWVRFADDVATAEAPVTAAARAWARPNQLPEQASSLLSASSRHPTGLTEYFQSQSGGRFSLTGASFPEVLVSDENELAYKQGNGTLNQGKLTRELLEKVDASGRIDLDDFDADRDGFVDYVFVIVRAMKSTRLYPSHASGVSDLGYTSEGPEFGRRSRLQVSRHASGSYARYDNAGNIFPETDLVRLLAHEIGHDIWTDYVHLLPVAPAPGIPPYPVYQVGYALMSGPSDARGDETISAVERDWVGWIACTPLARDTTFVVRDLYSAQSDNCFTMDVPQPGAYTSSRKLYLSHRARIGPFDRLLTEPAEQARSDQGLMDTGLLVMAAETGGRVGPVPADGELNLSARAQVYAGDLFRPGDRLTPWSRPNSTGYITFPRTGLRLTDVDSLDHVDQYYQALEIVEMVEPDGIRVAYRADDRLETTFRDGDHISVLPRLAFRGSSRALGRLEILGSASFEELRLDGDAEVSVLGAVAAGRLILEPGAVLRIEGVVRVDAAVARPTSRVILGPTGRLEGPGAQALRSAANPGGGS